MSSCSEVYCSKTRRQSFIRHGGPMTLCGDEFPRLRRLEAHFIHGLDGEAIIEGHAHILFHGSFQRLESLVLDSIPQCVEFNIGVLPSLQQLSVTRYGNRWGKAVGEQLSWTDPGSYTYFPNLRALNLSGSRSRLDLPTQTQSPEEVRTIITCLPQLEDLRLAIDSSAEPILAGFSPEKCKRISEWMEAKKASMEMRSRRIYGLRTFFKECFCRLIKLMLSKDGVSISDLKRLKRLELTNTDPEFANRVGILYGISDCATIQHLTMSKFKLTTFDSLIYKAIANKMTNLSRLELRVHSMTETSEKLLHASIEHVNIQLLRRSSAWLQLLADSD